MARLTLALVTRLTAAAFLTVAFLCASSATLAGAQASAPACPPAPSTGTPGTTTAVPPVPPEAALGSVQPTSEQVLACVGAETITGATYLHWASVARKAATPRHKHAQLPNTVAAEQVMGFLISSDWVIGEARERGVVVSEATVRKRFDHIRDQQFPRRGAFRRFLERSGQTVADLLFRVRLSLLSARIQKQVLAGHHGAHAQRQALANFVGEFRSKWTGQTYCEPAFAVKTCGHVQSL
jgi:hypothetical protein